MKIKSLLLGSAAALVAVSGANAADAIVAPEPEAVEYVKVCDTYGAGFFYIPGTETCLSINGYVRADFQTNNPHGDAGHSATFDYRARINFDTRSETELGTLRALARVQGQSGNFTIRGEDGDAAAGIDQAFIQLGGLTVGYTESFWATGGGYLNADGPYGYNQAGLIGYTFAQDGLEATIAAEFGSGSNTFATGNNNDSWTQPDVVGVLRYTGGWGSVWALAGYDNEVNEAAVKLGTEIKLDAISEGSKFLVSGTYDFGGDADGGTNNNTTRFSTGNEWDFIVAYHQPLGDTLAANLQYSASDDFDNGTIGGNLVWTPVANFSILGEVNYNLGNENYDTLLRFTRSF